ncbi:MAG: DUF6597 domain-containing transcriptional factor [Cyclobacteriaceae bacterium]
MIRYQEFKPSPQLAPYIKCYWLLESSGIPVEEKIMPDGCIEMLFHFGDQFVKNRSSDELVDRFFVNGQNTRPFLLNSTGATAVLGVRFYPFGAAPFLHLVMSELKDQFVTLESIYGSRVNSFTDQLGNETCWEGRIKRLEGFLVSELRFSSWTWDPVVNKLVNKVFEDKSRLNLSRYAGEVKYSERQVRRKFIDVVGINPSLFVRIIRFREIFKLRKQTNDWDLLGLALDSGYHDQSHFIRDFKQFAGQTPASFFNETQRMKSSFI